MAITVTKAEWDALLQEEYVHEGIVSAVNKATPFKSKLRRKSMTSGRRRIYPVQVGMSQGNGARGENESMPEYGAEEFVDAIVEAKYNYGTFKVTGPSMEFSTRHAWVEFGDRQLKGTKEGLTQDVGRQCWSDGSGKLALVNDAAAALGDTTVTVDSAFGVSWGSLSTKTTILLRKNMVIQFGASEDNSGAGYKITSLTTTTITFTPGLAAAVADDTAIYKLKTKDKEIEGFLKFVGTATFMTSVMGLSSAIYHGIDRTAYDSWEGNVVNAASAALTLALIRSLRDAVFERAEDEESNLCIVSPQMAAKYEALLNPGVRFVPQTLKGGVSILEHDGLKITKDSKCPKLSWQIMNTQYIAWAQTRDPHWDDDGSGPLHRVQGQDAREALLKWYANLDVDEPRRMGILYAIAA